MTVGKTDEIKQELARKVESTKAGTKLKKSMSIADMIKVMEPQIKKALPEVITPERFTRMALSALNTTPKLNECTPDVILSGVDECSAIRFRAKYATGTGIFNSIQ